MSPTPTPVTCSGHPYVLPLPYRQARVPHKLEGRESNPRQPVYWWSTQVLHLIYLALAFQVCSLHYCPKTGPITTLVPSIKSRQKNFNLGSHSQLLTNAANRILVCNLISRNTLLISVVCTSLHLHAHSFDLIRIYLTIRDLTE